MYETLWKCTWNAMHDHIIPNKQNPTQKFTRISKVFKKTQKFQENPKLRSKCVKCVKSKGFRTLTKWFDLGQGQNSRG